MVDVWVGAVCERCLEWGACLDGICVTCRNEVQTGDPALASFDAPGLHTSWCVVCGAEHDGLGEMCRRCHAETSAVTEPGWHERYAS